MVFGSSKSLFRIAAIVSVSGCLTGCKIHIVEQSPVPAVIGPVQFSVVEREQRVEHAPRRVWWSEFQNQELGVFINQSLENNWSIAQAAARMREAQSEQRKAKAAPLPAIDLGGGFKGDIKGIGTEEESSWELRRGVSLTWEIDLWNRLGSAIDATEFEAQARAADHEAVRLLVSAEVARSYYDAVEQQRLLKILSNQLETNRTLRELTELRFDQAGASAVDVFQQRQQLEATHEQVTIAKGFLRVAENRLDVLRGNASDGADSVTQSSFPKLSAAPTVGVPANLLVRRPDLRALQLQLVSEDYRIAEAIADRLPRVGIGASLEYAESALTGDLIRTAVADAVQPLIDWGERKAEVERRRAVFDEQLARFTEAYLVAIEEVENLIYLSRRQQDRLSSLIHQRDLSSRTLEEARNRYSNGLTDYLPVLDSVQTLQRIERQVIAQQRGLIENRIALHLAIGGSLKDS